LPVTNEEADGWREVEILVHGLAGFEEARRGILVDELPPGPGDAVERWDLAGHAHAAREVSLPVVRDHAVERGDEIVERETFYARFPARPTVEDAAEVVERLLALCLLADEDVRFEPDERAFVVVVERSAVGRPALRRGEDDEVRDRGIIERTPRAAAGGAH